jgi:septum formation protein
MFNRKLVLGSASPRRKELIEGLGLNCEVRTKNVDENYPADLNIYEVPEYLAQLKAQPLLQGLKEDEVLLTSDTVVIMNDDILHKPKDEQNAYEMLRALSGQQNEVVTGVSLISTLAKVVFSSRTKVFFSTLSDEDIHYYIKTYKPFDKAGGYGIQEWIGQIGVERIEGCFYNVMGLPIHQVWKSLNGPEFQVDSGVTS